MGLNERIRERVATMEASDRARQEIRAEKEAERAMAAARKIAKEVLGIETFRQRGVDRLDFHEIFVGSIGEALVAAYRAGRRSRAGGR